MTTNQAGGGWSMGLGGWFGVVGNATAVTLVCALFTGILWRLTDAHFEQAQFDRRLCRQQVAALTVAVEKHLESSRLDREEMKAILREVKAAAVGRKGDE